MPSMGIEASTLQSLTCRSNQLSYEICKTGRTNEVLKSVKTKTKTTFASAYRLNCAKMVVYRMLAACYELQNLQKWNKN